MVLTR
jgi:pyruvate/2-oxoglutarate/acetoin dehydrogenase E1 component